MVGFLTLGFVSPGGGQRRRPGRRDEGRRRDRQRGDHPGGAETVLALPAGAVGSEAMAINAGGDVAGIGYWPGDVVKAVVWRAGRATVLAGDGSLARAVTDSGVVVGTVDDQTRPVFWTTDGTRHPLATLSGLHSGDVVGAAGDWAAGYELPAAPGSQAKGDDPATTRLTGVRWNLRTGAAEAVTGIAITHVSASGTIVGRGEKPGEPKGQHSEVPMIWRDGRLISLPLPDQATGIPAGITADGRTVAATVHIPAGTQLLEWNGC